MVRSPQRSKFVEFFRGHPQIDDGRALRASRYFGPEPEERHVRFSVWTDDRAEAAVSLSELEADRLMRFLAMPRPRGASIGADVRRWITRLRD